jgi:CRP-like cAMP-binding protein
MNEHAPALQTLTRLELYFSIRHINKVMKTFGEVFDHDYETVAIFLCVAEVCLQAIFHLVALDPNEVNAQQLYNDINAVGMTAFGVGERTGIPRETVRRKIKNLIDKGYLAMSGKNKNIYLPTSTLLSERFLELFAGHIKDVGQMVRAIAYYQRDQG